MNVLVSPKEAYVEADVETLTACPTTFHAAAAAMLWVILLLHWQFLGHQYQVLRLCFV